MESSSTWDQQTNTRSYPELEAAGCNVQQWRAAFVNSPRVFNDLLSARFFRGVMPPTLRSNIERDSCANPGRPGTRKTLSKAPCA